MFSNFQPVNSAEWWSQVVKDLKGADVGSLAVTVEDGIVMQPFYTPEEVSESSFIDLPAENNAWQIGEVIKVEDEQESNRLALECLVGGVEAIVFEINARKNLSALLENIHLNYISTHFTGEYISTHFLEFLSDFEKCVSDKNIKGSFQIHNPSKEITAASKAAFPLFKIGVISSEKQESYTNQLLSVFTQAKNLCRTELGNQLFDTVFSMSVGANYLTEIAKIRAFKQLWYNLLSEYQLPLMEPELQITVTPPFADDKQRNMIAAATQTLSAVVGGASMVVVTPFSFENTSFNHRIARNVQHLLREESHLGYVKDIAAGSYYLENLTEAFAQKVWGGV